MAANDCVDGNLAATANDAPRIIWSCNGRPSRRWTRM
ncbi:hypothetical protein SCE1572_14135 [Sorangium cellulosum So0157-2]|uniref:Ricin B lectin domain-containing protein n=1 Tax=Sorangium cellulosum So0157-2 TaxID=1254432 RepID=S4XY90_SORCE|nr:hypothetical protein SCE1572_14135 [Sorangium cellulosum So0157-2]